ncbi:MAG: hypothetical protein ACI4MI_02445 [Christensenellales bacterium]
MAAQHGVGLRFLYQPKGFMSLRWSVTTAAIMARDSHAAAKSLARNDRNDRDSHEHKCSRNDNRDVIAVERSVTWQSKTISRRFPCSLCSLGTTKAKIFPRLVYKALNDSTPYYL